MKLRDFVVNSLPRVRGKKKTRNDVLPPEPMTKSRHGPAPQPPVRMSSVSRDSSVERASHVAVADANWRQSPSQRLAQDEANIMGAMAYYSPPPGMVLSHSAEGISTQSLALMTSHSPSLDYSSMPYNQMTAISESAVNYSMPRGGYLFQSQHHHRHNHQHNYHYVYHHHHHHQFDTDPLTRTPLVENNNLNHSTRCKTTPTSRKSEPGFLKKSFASFRALRKQRSNAKDIAVVKNKSTADENGKCMVCPYPQLQHTISPDPKKSTDTRPAKPKRKGLKSLKKSKPSQLDRNMDKSWYSDNDASHDQGHHLSDAELFYHSTMQRPRYRECSVESCMSRLYGGSQDDGCCGTESECRELDTHSLSGYDSDLPRSTSGRTRSRIRTNPWLPSPQPSLNIGRRFEQCDFRESREEIMTVDDDYPSMPRSASFDYQRPAILSSFQTTSSKERPVQRHRSLTSSDLKMTMSLNRKPKSVINAQPSPSETTQHSTHQIRREKDSMNDLNLSVSKSRPNSIISPSSEFVILADNIEQLANNISFEYEDMLDTTLETGHPCQEEDGRVSIEELLTDKEELAGNVENNEGNSFSNSSQSNSNAHSPDSGIGYLGSSDCDELTLAMPAASTPSPFPTACCGTPVTIGQIEIDKDGTDDKIHNTADTRTNVTRPDNSLMNWSHDIIPDSTGQCQSLASIFPSSDAGLNVSSLSDMTCQSSFSNTPTSRTIVSDKAVRPNVIDLIETMPEDMASLHGKQNHIKDSKKNAQSSVPKMLFLKGEDAVVEHSSTHHDGKLALDNSTDDFNDLHENKTKAVISKNQLHSSTGESILLPPNITRSELTTPVESPTENWQFGVEFMSELQTDFSDYNENHIDDKANGEGSKTQLVNSSSSDNCKPDRARCAWATNELTAVAIEGIISEHVAKQIEGGAITDSGSIDLADASVQTDFDDEEIESWHSNTSPILDDLCNGEFDAIESTRRWLLTGNMQGSADTGYSSQPRDSQILMDDDDSITACDTHNECQTLLSKTQLSDKEEEVPAMKIWNSETIVEQEAYSDLEMQITDKEITHSSEESGSSKCSHSERTTQPDELVHSMFSGIESQFKDIFHQLWSSQSPQVNAGNKRDSSGSSTSTLISESVGSASISSPIPGEESGFDESTPRNSGIGQIDLNTEAVWNQPQCVIAKKVSKKKKTSSSVEPDYVNVPRKGRSSKSNGTHVRAGIEKSHKDNTCGNLKKGCSVRRYPCSAGQSFDNIISESNSSSSSSSVWSNNDAMVTTDRADYLEFLRDAPLSNAHIKRPMFLIPGFGPIDMSPAPADVVVEDRLIAPNEDSWAYNRSSLPATVHCHAPKSVRTQAKALYAAVEPETQPIISEGRPHGSKTNKWSRDKESHESAPCRPSVYTIYDNKKQDPSIVDKKVPMDKPKRKNPRALQATLCPTRTLRASCLTPDESKQNGVLRVGVLSTKTAPAPHNPSSLPDTSAQSLAERICQLQREKDLIYMQLKEVQQEELSRHRQQLQHHRNVHSQRKDTLLETLRELKVNLEEQSRKLNLACNSDVYI